MSFEAYLACFQDGEEGYFPTTVVDEAFAPFVTGRDPEFSLWTVTYNDAPSILDQTDLYLNRDPEDASRCSGVTLARPSGNPHLFDSLLKILKTTNSTVYSGGECPPMVGRIETIAHLPPEMIETLGSPVVVSSGGEIRGWLARS